jgi:hypothetical protein
LIVIIGDKFRHHSPLQERWYFNKKWCRNKVFLQPQRLA